MVDPRPIECIAPPTAEAFARDIAPLYRPIVMRGLVKHWPVVAAGLSGNRAIAEYLKPLDSGAPTTVFSTPPEADGRFFYAADMRGLNFGVQQVTLTRLLDTLVELAGTPNPPGLYAGATPTTQSAQGFARDNVMPLATPGGEPRIWIGNATQASTHYDGSHNIACVVAGRRRFTLFPPEQIGNLYVGPVDRTPAGQPVSMVDLVKPDLDRYPRFAEAMKHAVFADLEPGDAIYIPALWWHHVRSTASLNVLINYWYRTEADTAPFAAVMHALLAIRELPQAERNAWRAWFEHYVFSPDARDAVAHLPEHAHGVLSAPSRRRDEIIKGYIMQAMTKPG